LRTCLDVAGRAAGDGRLLPAWLPLVTGEELLPNLAWAAIACAMNVKPSIELALGNGRAAISRLSLAAVACNSLQTCLSV